LFACLSVDRLVSGAALNDAEPARREIFCAAHRPHIDDGCSTVAVHLPYSSRHLLWEDSSHVNSLWGV